MLFRSFNVEEAAVLSKVFRFKEFRAAVPDELESFTDFFWGIVRVDVGNVPGNKLLSAVARHATIRAVYVLDETVERNEPEPVTSGLQDSVQDELSFHEIVLGNRFCGCGLLHNNVIFFIKIVVGGGNPQTFEYESELICIYTECVGKESRGL